MSSMERNSYFKPVSCLLLLALSHLAQAKDVDYGFYGTVYQVDAAAQGKLPVQVGDEAYVYIKLNPNTPNSGTSGQPSFIDPVTYASVALFRKPKGLFQSYYYVQVHGDPQNNGVVNSLAHPAFHNYQLDFYAGNEGTGLGSLEFFGVDLNLNGQSVGPKDKLIFNNPSQPDLARGGLIEIHFRDGALNVYTVRVAPKMLVHGVP